MAKSQSKTTEQAQENYQFTKKIGTTTFITNVYFNTENKESLSDKIMRLLRNDIANGVGVDE